MSRWRNENASIPSGSVADESLRDSPAPESNRTKGNIISTKPAADGHHSFNETQQSHDAELRQELASVRKVNDAIEGVIESLERAKVSMGVSISRQDRGC